MKNILLFFFVLALIVPIDNLFAQNKEEFVVFSKKGEVQVQKGAKGSFVSLKVGDKLFSKDKILVKAGAAVTLYHSTLKKSVELKKSATLAVKSLVSDLEKRKSYNDRFKDYVTSEMTASNSLFTGGKDENLNTMGSVDRNINTGTNESQLENLTGTDKNVSKAALLVADELAASNSKLIQIKLPRSTYLIDNEVEFSWYERQGSGVYEFRIIDNNDKVIYSKKLHNYYLTVNLDEAKLSRGTTYYWYVVDGDYQSHQYSICRMADSDAKAINDIVGDIDLDGMSSLDKISLASFYEDKNIMNRAVKVYDEVLKDYPDSPEFKKLYARYLIRIGLFSEATKVMGTDTAK